VIDHFQQIYRAFAHEYQQMIAAEDADRNLANELNNLVGETCPRLLDLGSGTGRIPAYLANQAGQLVALDLHSAMLAEQRKIRSRQAGEWGLVQADMRSLPIAGRWAHATIAGWSIGHLRSWYAQDWRGQIGRVLAEMLRVTRPGGWLIILETLGTGSLAPAPPGPELAEYYDWLEQEYGFARQILSTDYQFASVEEAVEKTEFFFGPELARRIQANQWSRIPEWTGLWKRQAG
jgi:ubiquinone/menaquinone biosynthesis C-methylase UbiE